jgi:L-lactate dehydrogenase
LPSECGVSSHHVLGSGTTLDTARFRALLGQHAGVDPNHIHGYVIGEHGDSEVVTWSLTNVGNLPLQTFCELQGISRSTTRFAGVSTGRCVAQHTQLSRAKGPRSTVLAQRWRGSCM